MTPKAKHADKPFIVHHHINGIDNGAKLVFPVADDGTGFSEEAAVKAAEDLGYSRRGVSVHYKLTTDGHRVFDGVGAGGGDNLVRCNVLSVFKTKTGEIEDDVKDDE